MADTPEIPDALKNPKAGEGKNPNLTQRAGAPIYTTRPEAEGALPPESLSAPRTPRENRDYFTPKPEAQRAIGDNYTPRWIRDPKVWKTVSLVDRLDEIQQEYEGAEQVKTASEPDGVRLGADLILVKIPKEHTDRAKAETDAARVDYEADLERDDSEEGNVMVSHKNLWNPLDKEALYRQARQQHALYERMGMVGPASKTSGLGETLENLMRARQIVGKEQMERDQEMYRNMGYHEHGDAQEHFHDVIRRAAGDIGKTFGVGNTGLGRTTQQKVAANQRAR